MEADFIDLLLDASGVTALVGTRVHWSVLPQSTDNPAVVLHKIDGVPDYTMAGPSGLVSSRVQIDVRGDSFASAISARDAIDSVLSGYAATQGDTILQGIFKLSERQGFEKPSGLPGYHKISTDWRVCHRPTA